MDLLSINILLELAERISKHARSPLLSLLGKDNIKHAGIKSYILTEDLETLEILDGSNDNGSNILTLENEELTESEIIAISNALIYNKSITSLDLSGNNIGDNDVVELANTLKYNDTTILHYLKII